MTPRSHILKTADELINGDRQKDYGPPEENFLRILDLWRAYLKARGIDASDLTASDVAIMMALLKIARTVESPKMDSFVDMASYCALAGELAGVKP